MSEEIMVYLGIKAWKGIWFTACAKTGHWENYSYTNSPNWIRLLDLCSSILIFVLWCELVQSSTWGTWEDTVFFFYSPNSRFYKNPSPILGSIENSNHIMSSLHSNFSIASQFIHIKSKVIIALYEGLDLCCSIY